MTCQQPVPPIVQANMGNLHDCTALIAEAFADLDVAAWLVPDRADRQRALYANFRIIVEHALLGAGRVDLTDDRTGVAVWFPRTATVAPIVGYGQRLQAAVGVHVHRFQALDAAFAAHHPSDPHYHLAFLAVQPGRQRAGIGSALLHHGHRLLDATGIPACLEASSEAARRLYLRHGYHDQGEPFTPAPDAPALWPMWRPAPGSPERGHA